MGVRSTRLPKDVSESNRATSQLATMAAIAAAAQLVSVEPWIAAPGCHALWLPGAALMCALLWRPYREWLVCILGTFLGCVGMLALRGATAAEASSLIMGLLVLVAIATLAIRQTLRPDAVVEEFPQVAWFLLIAVLALPLASASWTLLVARITRLPDFMGPWHNQLLTNALSYLLVVPTFIALGRLNRPGRHHPPFSTLQSFLALSLLLILWIAWMRPWSSPVVEPTLMLATTVILVWLLLVLGPAGAFLALTCSTILCMAISSHGLGPLALGDSERTTMAVQLWALIDGIMLLLLSALMEQRQAARNSLRVASVRLAEVTERMLRVQEEERTRIARDLHDDINQSLAAISIQLSSLKRATPTATLGQVEELQEKLLEVSGDVRRLSHDLHPSLLRYTSLASALKGLCNRCSGDAYRHTRIHCEISEDVALDEAQKLNLFRIAQEAIHNVNQHAHACNAWVRLHFNAGEGVMEIEDDGVGMGPAGTVMPNGLGMISIEERARLLGGTSRMRPRVEGGTVLTITFPVNRVESAPLPGTST